MHFIGNLVRQKLNQNRIKLMFIVMLEPRKGTERINSGIDRPGWLGGKV